MFIPARAKLKIRLPGAVLKRLSREGKIGLVSTAQHFHELGEIKKQLKGSTVVEKVLGCSPRSHFAKYRGIDTFLFVGSGRFHPINIKIKTGKKVYAYEPYSKKLDAVSEEEIEKRARRQRAGMAKLLSSERIGIIISTKEGQERTGDAERLAEKLRKKGKLPYLLVSETVDSAGLEAFTFIECFVNTACPRLAEDRFSRPVLNIDELGPIPD